MKILLGVILLIVIVIIWARIRVKRYYDKKLKDINTGNFRSLK